MKNNCDIEKVLEKAKEKYRNDRENRNEKITLTTSLKGNSNLLIKNLKFEKKRNFLSKKIMLSTSIQKKCKSSKIKSYKERNCDFSNRNFLSFPIQTNIFENDNKGNIINGINQIDKNLNVKIYGDKILNNKKNKNDNKNKKLNLLQKEYYTLKNVNCSIKKVLLLTVIKFRHFGFENNFSNKKNSFFDQSIFKQQYYIIPTIKINDKYYTKILNIPNKDVIEKTEPFNLMHKKFFLNENRMEIKKNICNKTYEFNWKNEPRRFLFFTNLGKSANKCINSFQTYKPFPFLFIHDFYNDYNQTISSVLNKNTSSNSNLKNPINLIYPSTFSTLQIIYLDKNKVFSNIGNINKPKTSNPYNNLYLFSTYQNSELGNIFIPLKPFSPSKMIKKRQYSSAMKTNITNNQTFPIIVNSGTIGSFLQNRPQSFIFSEELSPLDILFDINLCGIYLSSSDLNDEFELGGYDFLYDLINSHYVSYSNYVIIILDDEIKKREATYNINTVIGKLNNYLSRKFDTLIKNKNVNLRYEFKSIRCIRELYETIVNIWRERNAKNGENEYTIKNCANYEEMMILMSKTQKLKKISPESMLNDYEITLLNALKDNEMLFNQALEEIQKVIIYFIFIYRNTNAFILIFIQKKLFKIIKIVSRIKKIILIYK